VSRAGKAGPAISRAHEDEQKFSVQGAFTLPDLTDPEHGVAAAVEKGTLELRATYYDAADLRLAREGITLRHRTGEDSPVWTLKLPAGGTSRTELTLPARSRTVPPQLRTLLTAWLRGEPLLAATTLHTRRQVTSLRDDEGTEIAEVVDDDVSVLEGREVVSGFREVEVERRGISADAFDAVADRIVAAGAVHGQQVSKAIRALGPRAATPSDLPPPREVLLTDPAAGLVALSLRTNTRRLLLADLGVRQQEPDGVHQLRVACRHLRSDLRTLRDLVDAQWATLLREELAWLANGMGLARDTEVLRERLAAVIAAEDEAAASEAGLAYDHEAWQRLDALLGEREQGALRDAAAVLISARYLRLVDALIAAAREPVTTPAAAAPCSIVLPALLAQTWRRLESPARRLGPLVPDAQWHRTRIRAKQARYAAEAFAPVLGAPAEETAAAAKKVQESLGIHQDAVVAADTLLAIAAEHPADGQLSLLLGRLVEASRHQAAASRDEFPDVWRAARERVPSSVRKAARA